MTTPFASPNTDRTTTLAIAIRDLIKVGGINLGIKPNNVRYGNHLMNPESPTVVIRPGRKRRTLRGVANPGGRTENQIYVLIDVMSADVLPGEEEARIAIDTLAEDVEKLLYVDVTIGGLVIHGFVEDMDPGEILINNSRWRTVRMFYVGKSLTYLSPPAAPV